jgi:hypothetical protein
MREREKLSQVLKKGKSKTTLSFIVPHLVFSFKPRHLLKVLRAQHMGADPGMLPCWVRK